MIKVYFFTQNKEKFLYAKKIFSEAGIELVRKQKKFVELRSDNISEITENKMSQVKSGGVPFIVEDSGLFINSLHGFPGAQINSVLEKIGVGGLLKLVGNKKRACFFKSVVGVCYNDRKKFFTQIDEGKISRAVARKDCQHMWSSLWKIFVPAGYSKQLSVFSKDELEKIEKRWLKNSNFRRAAFFIRK